jgi:4-hydroxy-tetrahydrodipicolinate reductase
MTRLAITGATGRMGRTLLETARDRDCDVVVATSRRPKAGPIEGVTLQPATQLGALLDTHEVDVLVDFTTPAATREAIAAARHAETDVAVVVGTTGFLVDDRERLKSASEDLPLLVAANFARGVQALTSLVGDVAEALSDYDVELLETHHAGKRDAPSGTATRLLDEIEAVQDEETERVHGREGDAARTDSEIGVHSLRAGDVSGAHEIVFAGNGEQLRLTHRAGDRSVFAEGALDAATWLAGRDPGWYEFADVLANDAGGDSHSKRARDSETNNE